GSTAPLALRGRTRAAPHRVRRASHRARPHRDPLPDVRRWPRRACRDDHRRGRGGDHAACARAVSGRLLHPRMPPRRSGRAHPLWHAGGLPGGQGGEVPGGETTDRGAVTMDACNLPPSWEIPSVCELLLALPVVVAVIGIIVWMALNFEEASRENDWPPLRREGDAEPARS